jgi:hypothetical protein
MDTKGALAKYAILAADPESPDSLRRRAQAMTDFLKTGGAVAYGTVPPPPPPAPALNVAGAPAAGAPAAAAPANNPAPAKSPAAPKPAK